MKKIISCIAMCVLLLAAVACGQQPPESGSLPENTPAASQPENIPVASQPVAENTQQFTIEEYFDSLIMALGYTWSDRADSQLLTVNNAMFFKRALESIYKMETGDIPHTDGKVPVSFYVDIALRHFPWDEQTVINAVTANGENLLENDMVYITDGLGNVRQDIVTEIKTEDGLIKIHYKSGTPAYDPATDSYTMEDRNFTDAVLTVREEEGRFVFVSNENAYIDFVNSRDIQRYLDALSPCLAAQWDENGGELTENTERFKKALENLYDILYNGTREFPHNNGVADIEEYVRTADKFFPFGGRTVRAALENSQGYSRETGTVPVSEYPDEADRPEIAEFKDTDGGYTVTYSIKTGRFAQAQLQVKSTFDGYYMFVSNEIVK